MFKKNVIKFIESQFFKIKTGKMLFRSLVLSLEGLGKSVRRGFRRRKQLHAYLRRYTRKKYRFTDD
ncbi:hypothetical protein AGMMS5026_00480 [Endomicrobiia bacterium]|nr:hypothetical protein AGMMS49571_01900 [Endomicrobiia bacterium]GHT21288.1 hypothetical protein AGMMS49929_09630 [Endomicrobiia bacterium]GHT27502.1 hypothetical protein AGMMS49995_06690 [Endomicrobiia bacterium]GHT29391.1 hypothetical protein AGMMS5026_00480 [Endomicrobiia bacterium]